MPVTTAASPIPKERQKIRLWWKIRGVPLAEKIFYAQHLGVMLKAGISLGSALITLSEQTQHRYFKVILKDISERVNQGQSLAKSLALYPGVFEEFFVNMIAAGEVSGKYEEVLDELYKHLKKSHELKSKIRGAMIYPIIIIVAMIVIAILMLTFVVPKLITIFEESGVELPLPTRILIGITNGFLTYGLFIGIGVIVFVTFVVLLFKKEKPKFILHALLLRLPIFGGIIKKINIARFSRTLGALLKTDIPIMESLLITSRVVKNRPYRKALEDAVDVVKKGQAMNTFFVTRPNLFSPLISQMVMIGEETGTLDNILKELADFFEEDVRQTMDNLPSIIEPILIVLLGIGVAGMAVAFIMPLYSLTEAI